MNADLLDLEEQESLENISNFNRSQHQAYILRVLRVLKTGIKKLTIALIIPVIVEHPECLKLCVSPEEFSEFIEICTKYFPPNCENTIVDYEKIIDLRIIEVIEMLHSNEAFKAHIPKYIEKLPDEDKELLASFGDLSTIAGIRLSTSASSEINREKVIHVFYLSNEEVKEKIKRTKTDMLVKRIVLKWKTLAKNALLDEYDETLKAKKWENAMITKKEMDKTTERMEEMCNTSAVKQGYLLEEYRNAKSNYEVAARKNIDNERKTRAIKNRNLIQLQTLIHKYDTDIINKIKESDGLSEEIKKKREEIKEFNVEFEKIEEEYLDLVHKKYMEEKIAFENKLYLFMANRAARIIQKYWKIFWKKKQKELKSKGKDKKGKKKK
ncbi:hypothetical protein ACFFRR_002761 [Megaselia abdita]